MFIGCTAIAGAQFHMEMAPMFTPDMEIGTQPVAIDITNDGGPANGTLTVNSAGEVKQYSVHLTGGDQRVVTYTTLDGRGVIVTLNTDQGKAVKLLPFTGGRQAGQDVLSIGGSAEGSLVTTHRLGGTFNANAKPDEAPTRAIGYAPDAAVVLLNGAELMSDASVAALKQWTLEGGTLVFLGASSRGPLEDPRWREVLPATKFKPETVPAPAKLASMGEYEISGNVTLLEPKDLQGAAVRSENGVVLTAESGYGAGKIAFTAFDPFDAKLQDWSGNSNAVMMVLKPSLNQPKSFASQAVGSLDNVAAIPARYSAEKGASAPANDPFEAALPSTTKVFGILVAYFISVVPLNFFILRRLKRGELAWFTAPVISLAFASALFRSTDNLYGDKLSTASTGMVIMQSGSPKGVFLGSTEMFIPRGGHYDLQMSGIDSSGAILVGQNWTQANNASDEVISVDDGKSEHPTISAGNLAFRQLEYRQSVDLGSDYSLNMHRDGKNVVCEIRNGGKAALTNSSLLIGRFTETVPAIMPGETKVVTVPQSAITQVRAADDGSIQGFGEALGYSERAALYTHLPNFRPGPQIGDEISSRSDVRLALFSKDAIGVTK